MKKNYYSRELKIGVSAIICLTLMFFGFNYLKGINILKPSNYYYARVNNVSGLAISSPVFVNGFNMGLVRNIKFNPEKPSEIILELGLNSNYKLPKGAKAHVITELMGTALLNLEYDPNETVFLNPGDTIEAIRENSITEKATDELLPQIQATLPKIDSVLTALQRLLENPALAASLQSIEGTTKQLELASTQLNVIMKNDLPKTLQSVNNVSSNLETFTEGLNEIDLSYTAAQVNKLLITTQNTLAHLNDTNNNLGLLLNDRNLYDNLTKTAESTNALLVDLRQNPKRYVHFSLFGRKKD